MTAHRWLLVPVRGDPTIVNVENGHRLRDIMGGDVDFGVLSRHFHFAVHENSLKEMERSTVINRNRTVFPIHGPCLVFKIDDSGSTVSMTDEDAERVSDVFYLGRFSIGVDSMDLG